MDVLFALSSDETSQNLGPNRIPRIAAHLLQQQSFCPQFPVPASLVSQVSILMMKFISSFNYFLFSWISVNQNIGNLT